MKRTKSKRSIGLVTRRIVFINRRRPHDRPRDVTVDIRGDETIDDNYAAAMVATRTGLALTDVKIINITP